MNILDTNAYNYKNLKPEDRRFIEAYEYAISVAGNKGVVVDDILGLRDKSDVLSQIKKDVASEVIDAVIEHMRATQTEIVVHMIDQYQKKQ